MVPFQTLVLVLERAVRDVAHSEAKQVNFRIDGSEVELDKQVLETLKDPLLHLLRNAVDHGIETPAVREAAGKPPGGTVILTVQQRGSEVHIKITDDGQGFDQQSLLEAYRQRNGNNLPENLADDDIMGLAFLPGVTTTHQVTTISGRGMGLDVVRQRIESIQGRIAVESSPGQGATVRLVVPTSLAMTRGLLVQVGKEGYVIPLLSVEKIVEPDASFVVSGKWMLKVDDAAVPLVSLSQVLERPAAPKKEKASNPIAVVIGVSDQRLALLVDDIVTEQELAVKPLGKPLQRVRNVTGAALLGSGEPVVVLNPADLVKSARGVTAAEIAPVVDKHTEEAVEVAPHSILVVDDSITTRTLEKNILTAAGFLVTTATDGTEALKRLEEKSIDLVVADVQMPHMDGITLTQELRRSADYQTLPIILVTSLESPEDREKGMVAGADAYIIKRGFDQAELLATIARLL
jgi:two-component system chemotaxis sensor kinase CheA